MLRSWSHFSDVEDDEWPWINFSPSELACRGTGRLRIDTDMMDKLQALRTRMGVALIVLSGYRSPEHNAKVGGAKDSQHTKGTAVDVAVANVDPEELIAAALELGFTWIKRYPVNGFVHLDIRPARQASVTGPKFPPRGSRFTAEPPRQPESLAQSATATGAATSGVLVMASEAVNQLGDVLGPYQDVVPAVRYVLLAGAVMAACVILYKQIRQIAWRS
jgi:hypothetical protein